jgi:hypothetical protein
LQEAAIPLRPRAVTFKERQTPAHPSASVKESKTDLMGKCGYIAALLMNA